MKIKWFFTALLMGSSVTSFSQQNPAWEEWARLTGTWKGQGSGQPGTGGGIFSFTFDLNNKILVRKSHSEYPVSGNKPAIIHDDLMIIYPDSAGNPSQAIYFDNEGHAINYDIRYSGASLILISRQKTGSLAFRLTYTLQDDDTLITLFEISQDGKKFTPYIQGVSKKVS